MSDNIIPFTVQGKYYWELLFNYDNSDNPAGQITETTKIRRKKTVNSRLFLSNKLNINSGFRYKNTSSVSLRFDGVTGNSNSDFELHLDLANELVKTSEKAEILEEESEIERTFVIGPGGKLSLYRLCYDSDGVSLKTDTVSTEPTDDVFVELKFTCKWRILGLEEVLSLFRTTVPGSSNTLEWSIIRDHIVQDTDKPSEIRFHNFIKILNTIKPGSDNIAEWNAIRSTCSQLLNDWDATPKQLLLKKLLVRFQGIEPGSDNIAEWARIRALSRDIVKELTEVF